MEDVAVAQWLQDWAGLTDEPVSVLYHRLDEALMARESLALELRQASVVPRVWIDTKDALPHCRCPVALVAATPALAALQVPWLGAGVVLLPREYVRRLGVLALKDDTATCAECRRPLRARHHWTTLGAPWMRKHCPRFAAATARHGTAPLPAVSIPAPPAKYVPPAASPERPSVVPLLVSVLPAVAPMLVSSSGQKEPASPGAPILLLPPLSPPPPQAPATLLERIDSLRHSLNAAAVRPAPQRRDSVSSREEEHEGLGLFARLPESRPPPGEHEVQTIFTPWGHILRTARARGGDHLVVHRLGNDAGFLRVLHALPVAALRQLFNTAFQQLPADLAPSAVQAQLLALAPQSTRIVQTVARLLAFDADTLVDYPAALAFYTQKGEWTRVHGLQAGALVLLYQPSARTQLAFRVDQQYHAQLETCPPGFFQPVVYAAGPLQQTDSASGIFSVPPGLTILELPPAGVPVTMMLCRGRATTTTTEVDATQVLLALRTGLRHVKVSKAATGSLRWRYPNLARRHAQLLKAAAQTQATLAGVVAHAQQSHAAVHALGAPEAALVASQQVLDLLGDPSQNSLGIVACETPEHLVERVRALLGPDQRRLRPKWADPLQRTRVVFEDCLGSGGGYALDVEHVISPASQQTYLLVEGVLVHVSARWPAAGGHSSPGRMELLDGQHRRLAFALSVLRHWPSDMAAVESRFNSAYGNYIVRGRKHEDADAVLQVTRRVWHMVNAFDVARDLGLFAAAAVTPLPPLVLKRSRSLSEPPLSTDEPAAKRMRLAASTPSAPPLLFRIPKLTGSRSLAASTDALLPVPVVPPQ